MSLSGIHGVLLFALIGGGLFVLSWIAAAGRMKREERRAIELAEEIAILLVDFGPERALDRLREYRGPFWFACTEVLRPSAHDEPGIVHHVDLARGVAQRAGGPWDVLVSLLVVVFVGGGFLFGCTLCAVLALSGRIDDEPDPQGKHAWLGWISPIFIVLAVLGLVAMSALRRQRTRLAGRFASLLDQVAVAAGRAGPRRDGASVPPDGGQERPGAGP